MKSIKELLEETSIPQPKPSGGSPPPEPERYRCSFCQDRGIIFDGEVARPCTCMNQKKLENRFRHARIARSLIQCRFEGFDIGYYDPPEHRENAQRALAAAQAFVASCLSNQYGLGLLFTGSVGSGKTFLAAAIANALTEKERQVLFLIVPDLLDELRGTYDRRGEATELDLLDTARSIPILILDDLGAHNYTEWARNRLYTIINYRLNEQLPTVITTNLSLQEMEEYLGERTTSRLVQMSRVFRLTCEQDIRLRKYQEREGKRM
ncbi:MAG: ATP-binding protein [Desulfitobacteriaceae bacterium]|nr:ATP-binding protein [Desulfitobacteriaceae bacterium]MDI6913955.1 ATP-binding protein [Desulfitobacteriaceae bacterium]